MLPRCDEIAEIRRARNGGWCCLGFRAGFNGLGTSLACLLAGLLDWIIGHVGGGGGGGMMCTVGIKCSACASERGGSRELVAG